MTLAGAAVGKVFGLDDRPQEGEELAIALPTRPRGGNQANGLEPGGGRIGGKLDEDTAVDRGVSNHATSGNVRPAGLELGLDQGHDLPVRMQQRANLAKDQAERDERQVERGQVDRLGERGQGAQVRAIHHNDPLVRRQAGQELSMSHVHGVNPARAMAQQHVGKAAGRRAGIEADRSRHVELERIERGQQLLRAARRPRRAWDADEPRIGIEPLAGGQPTTVTALEVNRSGKQEGLRFGP